MYTYKGRIDQRVMKLEPSFLNTSAITDTNSNKAMEFITDYDTMVDLLNQWHNGSLIQEVFPLLTTDEREFLMSGSAFDELIDKWAED